MSLCLGHRRRFERSSYGSCGRDYQDCDNQSMIGRYIMMQTVADITMSPIHRMLLKSITSPSHLGELFRELIHGFSKPVGII